MVLLENKQAENRCKQTKKPKCLESMLNIYYRRTDMNGLGTGSNLRRSLLDWGADFTWDNTAKKS